MIDLGQIHFIFKFSEAIQRTVFSDFFIRFSFKSNKNFIFFQLNLLLFLF